MDSYAKKRKPNYGYKPNHNSKPKNALVSGLKGFLCTCNFREKDCIRESYNLLNEYADRLYESEHKDTNEPSGDVASSTSQQQCDSDDEDIQTSLNKEIESLKAEGHQKPEMRKFQVVESGSKNCLFIRTTLPDPVSLVHYIIKDLEDTKKQKTRFLLRLLPIEATCKAYLDDIKASAEPLLDKYFVAEGKTFSILFNCRNNKSVSRDKVIDELAKMVADKNPGNRVDLKQPELAVLVEIIRNICCISVLPDYYKFRRYNLLEITGADQSHAAEKTGDGNDDVEEGDGDASKPVAEAGDSTNLAAAAEVVQDVETA